VAWRAAGHTAGEDGGRVACRRGHLAGEDAGRVAFTLLQEDSQVVRRAARQHAAGRARKTPGPTPERYE